MSDKFKVINYDSYDFTNSAIIKPKTENFDDAHRIPTKTTCVVIGSADRNQSSYPNPNDYYIELYEELQDVISVELKYAYIKHNEYNITQLSDTLRCSSASITTPSDYKIAHGIYTGSKLAEVLTTLGFAQGIQVIYDELTMHVKLSADEQFTIYTDPVTYRTGSLLKVLGFRNSNQTASLNVLTGRYELESAYALDLAPNNAIVINIDTMNVKVSNNNTFNKAFAIIPPKYNEIQTSDKFTIKKVFSPPLGRIDKLHIKMQDIHGHPYDFQNKDHLLEFVFESHRNIRKYQTYLS